MTSNAIELATEVAERVAGVEGVVAVVLGGSHARGTARPDSDIDIGLLYRGSAPFAVEDLRRVAADIDDTGTGNAVTERGGWGPWVDGGAWLEVKGHAVDWLYRDVERIDRAIEDCHAGRITCEYQVGHPHGFHNHMYAGEIHYAVPLVDPDGLVPSRQARTTPYPPALQSALITRFLREAEFSAAIARKPARRGDLLFATGCLFRAASCLVQVVYAINERWFVNEKGSLLELGQFDTLPERFADTISDAFSGMVPAPGVLETRVDAMHWLAAATRRLVEPLVGGALDDG